MRRQLAFVALAILGACTNEIEQSTRPENIVGSYQLVSLGGAPLPTTFSTDSGKMVVLAGILQLSADRSWSENVSVTTTIRGVTTSAPEIAAGTWTLVRSQAYLAFTDTVNGYQFSGVAAGGSIVLETDGGRQLVYRR